MILGDKKLDNDYFNLISKIESNHNPKAKNPNSTASGRFQFIRSTWEGLGYKWADVFNDDLQWQAIRKFTEQNANILRANGCAINFATLYGAHFLGASGFLRIMRADPKAGIDSVTSAAQRKANPTILKGTVADFCEWLRKKTGDSVYKRYTKSGWVDGHGIEVPPGDELGEEKGGVNIGAILVAFVIAAAFIIYHMMLG